MASKIVKYPASSELPQGLIAPGSGEDWGRSERLGEAIMKMYRLAFVLKDNELRDCVLDRTEQVVPDLESMGLWRP